MWPQEVYCPQHIQSKGKGGTPYLDWGGGGKGPFTSSDSDASASATSLRYHSEMGCKTISMLQINLMQALMLTLLPGVTAQTRMHAVDFGVISQQRHRCITVAGSTWALTPIMIGCYRRTDWEVPHRCCPDVRPLVSNSRKRPGTRDYEVPLSAKRQTPVKALPSSSFRCEWQWAL